jgi:hypothetical protein
MANGHGKRQLHTFYKECIFKRWQSEKLVAEMCSNEDIYADFKAQRIDGDINAYDVSHWLSRSPWFRILCYRWLSLLPDIAVAVMAWS